MHYSRRGGRASRDDIKGARLGGEVEEEDDEDAHDEHDEGFVSAPKRSARLLDDLPFVRQALGDDMRCARENRKELCSRRLLLLVDAARLCLIKHIESRAACALREHIARLARQNSKVSRSRRVVHAFTNARDAFASKRRKHNAAGLSRA